MRIDIYTDGACSGNPGPGGYAFCIVDEGGTYEVKSGHRKETTNNCMELTAIVKALEYVANTYDKSQGIILKIYSDSAYCVNTITQRWYVGWMANEWRTSTKNTPVANKELWKRFVELISTSVNIKLQMVKVQGHSGNMFNEIADKAAVEASKPRNKRV